MSKIKKLRQTIQRLKFENDMLNRMLDDADWDSWDLNEIWIELMTGNDSIKPNKKAAHWLAKKFDINEDALERML